VKESTYSTGRHAKGTKARVMKLGQRLSLVQISPEAAEGLEQHCIHLARNHQSGCDEAAMLKGLSTLFTAVMAKPAQTHRKVDCNGGNRLIDSMSLGQGLR
jgi:hypothetical protein